MSHELSYWKGATCRQSATTRCGQHQVSPRPSAVALNLQIQAAPLPKAPSSGDGRELTLQCLRRCRSTAPTVRASPRGKCK